MNVIITHAGEFWLNPGDGLETHWFLHRLLKSEHKASQPFTSPGHQESARSPKKSVPGNRWKEVTEVRAGQPNRPETLGNLAGASRSASIGLLKLRPQKWVLFQLPQVTSGLKLSLTSWSSCTEPGSIQHTLGQPAYDGNTSIARHSWSHSFLSTTTHLCNLRQVTGPNEDSVKWEQ